MNFSDILRHIYFSFNFTKLYAILHKKLKSYTNVISMAIRMPERRSSTSIKFYFDIYFIQLINLQKNVTKGIFREMAATAHGVDRNR